MDPRDPFSENSDNGPRGLSRGSKIETVMEINISDKGASIKGTPSENQRAIQEAIDEVEKAGGGTVTVPQGTFISGTIFLKDNVRLHLSHGAVLMSSLDEKDISSFPREDDTDLSEVDGAEGGFFIGAVHAKNIRIDGSGTIDGQGEKVFFDEDLDRGFHECPKQTAGFRPRLLLFEDVEKLSVSDITLKDSAFWTFHMAGCQDVDISDITIKNDDRGVNNDGIDPDCCRNVIIRGCNIWTADDAIVIKSTAPMAKKYGSCENITVSDCILHTRCSALKIGTETFGTIRNITFGNCIVRDASRAVGIWMRDGGLIEKIMVHDITGQVRRYADCYDLPGQPGWWGKGEPIFVSATPRQFKTGSDSKWELKDVSPEKRLEIPVEEERPTGTIRRLSFSNIRIDCESCVFLAGEIESPISDVVMRNIEIHFEKQGTQAGGLFDEQPSFRGRYPHLIPGVYTRHVQGLDVDGVFVVAEEDNGTEYCGKEIVQEED